MSYGQKSVPDPRTHLSTSFGEGLATCSYVFAVNNSGCVCGWREDVAETQALFFMERKSIYQHLFSFVSCFKHVSVLVNFIIFLAEAYFYNGFFQMSSSYLVNKVEFLFHCWKYGSKNEFLILIIKLLD